MKSISGHLVVGATAVLGAAGLFSACVSDDSSIFLRGVMAPPTTATAGTTCLYVGDATQPMIYQGTLDTALLLTYTPTLLIGSQLLPRGNEGQVRVETSRVAIQGAIVRINDSEGRELRSFTRLGSAFIDPASGTTPSYTPFATTLVDSATGLSLRQALFPGGVTSGQVKRLVVNVKVFGTTLGGQKLESNELQFPVNVCYGCLISYPTDSVNQTLKQATGRNNCANTGSGTAAIPCIRGQDQIVDCRLCQEVSECDPGNITPPQPIVDAGGGG
ncbi:MAG: hypothetical protein WCI05_09110 [Myxococcales bacterium]